MPPQRAIEHRVTKLETRLTEVETSHGESLYKMNWRLAKHELMWRKVLQRFDILFQHLGIEAGDGVDAEVSDEDVDEALDQE